MILCLVVVLGLCLETKHFVSLPGYASLSHLGLILITVCFFFVVHFCNISAFLCFSGFLIIWWVLGAYEFFLVFGFFSRWYCEFWWLPKILFHILMHSVSKWVSVVSQIESCLFFCSCFYCIFSSGFIFHFVGQNYVLDP